MYPSPSPTKWLAKHFLDGFQSHLEQGIHRMIFAMLWLTFCLITKMKVEQPKTCRYGNCKYTYHANIERTYFLPSWGKHPIFPTLAMAAATAKVTFLFFAAAFLHEADAECPSIESWIERTGTGTVFVWTCASFFGDFLHSPLLCHGFFFPLFGTTTVTMFQKIPAS